MNTFDWSLLSKSGERLSSIEDDDDDVNGEIIGLLNPAFQSSPPVISPTQTAFRPGFRYWKQIHQSQSLSKLTHCANIEKQCLTDISFPLVQCRFAGSAA